MVIFYFISLEILTIIPLVILFYFRFVKYLNLPRVACGNLTWLTWPWKITLSVRWFTVIYIHLSWHMAGPIVDCSTTLFYSYKPFRYSQYIPIILYYTLLYSHAVPILVPSIVPIFSHKLHSHCIPTVFCILIFFLLGSFH